jgi:hypothetical protein
VLNFALWYLKASIVECVCVEINKYNKKIAWIMLTESGSGNAYENILEMNTG